MKIIRLIAKYMGYAAAPVLIGLMMLTVANVIGRDFLRSPVEGTMELSSYMLAMIVALGLGWLALQRRHIKVDLMMDRLPKRAQYIIDNALLIVTFILLALMTWDNVVATMATTSFTPILHLKLSPFRWVFTVGLGVFCICTLAMIIENFRKRGKDES